MTQDTTTLDEYIEIVEDCAERIRWRSTASKLQNEALDYIITQARKAEKYREDSNRWEKLYLDSDKDYSELLNTIIKYKTALEWYSQPGIYAGMQGNGPSVALALDEGSRARKTLGE